MASGLLWKMSKKERTELVDLGDIVIPRKTQKSVERDITQLEQMRADFERQKKVVRIVLRRRFDGLYTVEDGRHRVLAARMAGESHIEAVIR